MTLGDANNPGWTGEEGEKNHCQKTGRYIKDLLFLFDTQIVWQQLGSEE